MKAKHLEMRFEQTRLLSKMSPCTRRQFGAVIVNPITNSTISEGYNGLPKGCEHKLCGGDTCARDSLGVVSGQRLEVGCHHAEANAITNAARLGSAVQGCWLIVNGEPCLMCAKLIHHSGIQRVYCIDGGYSTKNGVDYFRQHGVEVILN